MEDWLPIPGTGGFVVAVLVLFAILWIGAAEWAYRRRKKK